MKITFHQCYKTNINDETGKNQNVFIPNKNFKLNPINKLEQSYKCLFKHDQISTSNKNSSTNLSTVINKSKLTKLNHDKHLRNLFSKIYNNGFYSFLSNFTNISNKKHHEKNITINSNKLELKLISGLGFVYVSKNDNFKENNRYKDSELAISLGKLFSNEISESKLDDLENKNALSFLALLFLVTNLFNKKELIFKQYSFSVINNQNNKKSETTYLIKLNNIFNTFHLKCFKIFLDIKYLVSIIKSSGKYISKIKLIQSYYKKYKKAKEIKNNINHHHQQVLYTNIDKNDQEKENPEFKLMQIKSKKICRLQAKIKQFLLQIKIKDEIELHRSKLLTKRMRDEFEIKKKKLKQLKDAVRKIEVWWQVKLDQREIKEIDINSMPDDCRILYLKFVKLRHQTRNLKQSLGKIK